MPRIPCPTLFKKQAASLVHLFNCVSLTPEHWAPFALNLVSCLFFWHIVGKYQRHVKYQVLCCMLEVSWPRKCVMNFGGGLDSSLQRLKFLSRLISKLLGFAFYISVDVVPCRLTW